MPEIKEHELPVVAWLVTGGRIFQDTVVIHSNSAVGRVAERGDGSKAEPLTSHQAATEAIKELKGRLDELVQAANNYATRYAADEADDNGCEYTGCSQQQHEDAKALFSAIDRALSLEGGGET
jgi:hypothetical protein